MAEVKKIPRTLAPGIQNIQKKGIESFLNFIILRTLGMLSPEDLERFGANSISDIDGFLARVRGIFGMFVPDIFILHRLMDPSQNRAAGIVDMMVHTAKQLILYVGAEVPHIASLVGTVATLGVEGGWIGDLIGYGLSIVPSIAGIALSVSSKDPKGVLKNTAALIPVVGQDFVETMERFDSIATNAFNKSITVVEGVRGALDAVKDNSAFGQPEPTTEPTQVAEDPSNAEKEKPVNNSLPLTPAS